ncbi:MAG: amidohydrolase family protein [Anaerolineae bacterium]|nr:amidohydrolase family protein [Anaerolineae bacterium]
MNTRLTTGRSPFKGTERLPTARWRAAHLTMDRALGNFIAATGASLAEVWQTSSLNAARAIGVSASKGSLEAGKDADLVLVDDAINVSLTVAEGQIVYRG